MRETGKRRHHEDIDKTLDCAEFALEGACHEMDAFLEQCEREGRPKTKEELDRRAERFIELQR